jgi:release factor glutamine methyltransferase
MHTLLEILRKTETFLASKGMESARLEAELLLSSSLGLKRLDLYLQHDRLLPETELEPIRGLIMRRAKREPLQYITGSVEFADIVLKTDRRALIPRPETEQLVEILQQRNESPSTILDLGCGTGAIGLALAAHFKESRVTLVDLSQDALSLATENVRANQLQERVQLLQSDWFQNVEGRYDWIVSNPPYLTEEEWGSADPEVREFEPRSALVGGDLGLDPYRILFSQGREYLNPGGFMALETGIDMHPELIQLAEQHGWTSIQSVEDLSQRKRFFFAVSPKK